jgi:L-ribulose-5-phosphate 3-epimerase
MRVGIIQGRLSPPDEGFQECPKDWKSEFDSLTELGLNHIEWIITKKSFIDNPFFIYDLIEYPIYTVCADNLVNERIDDEAFMQVSLNPICKAAIRNNVKYITIPLLEESSLQDEQKRLRFKKILRGFAEQYPNIHFSLEAELEAKKLLDIVAVAPNVHVTYDTGNITSCGFDHEEYIDAISERISNVHLKDRTMDGNTVIPGSGRTNFKLIFDKLKDIGYSGVFTLQTARETPGEEKETINRHLQILRRINEQLI